VRIARIVSQAIFLLLFVFLFLQTESTGQDELGYPVKIFLDFDPLILLTSFLASHKLTAAFLLSGVTVLVTLVLGRVFCGWICPLGTLNNLVGGLRKRNHQSPGVAWRRIKYLVLIFLLAGALFSAQLAGLVDPLSFLIRSLAVGVYPALNHALASAFNTVYEANPPVVVDISEWIYARLRDPLMAFRQPYFRQGIFMTALFALVLGLNLHEKRFWCRNLCPLGALLGLLSRFALLKRSVSEGCNECGKCATVCPGAADPDSREYWTVSECYNCWNCDDVCPNNAVHFGFSRRTPGDRLDIGRRRALTAGLAGAVMVPVLRTDTVLGRGNRNPLLIRPPGSLDEGGFLERCVRCGECMKVCITNGLQPTLLEAGLEGLWSPVLIPTLGYCEYRCTLCGQVCPTGAIKRLSLEEKAKTRIGTAMVDRNRCLPWAHSRPCIVCEEVCPTPEKAIWLENVEVEDAKGRKLTVQRPRVDLELCIGCGICETKCPVEDQPAIYVTSIGESRRKENTLLW